MFKKRGAVLNSNGGSLRFNGVMNCSTDSVREEHLE